MTGKPLKLSELIETVRLVAENGSTGKTAAIQGKTDRLVRQHVKKAEQITGIKFFFPYDIGCLTREGQEYLNRID